ncbi:hypothetical protein Isop_0034 [Isosphaera pallida ATCC 43644]|uniref:Uncharacterized protein n=1 Tax=Isosphaera pallida (strain ATCC 43644 / DSM 9630 / IS1B) TaxID=575540 RepID=E8R4P0_ISOPI|nr:hypothetical protein Isop_0034 [Isosphaera pallida ATCC 43644]
MKENSLKAVAVPLQPSAFPRVSVPPQNALVERST